MRGGYAIIDFEGAAITTNTPVPASIYPGIVALVSDFATGASRTLEKALLVKNVSVNGYPIDNVYTSALIDPSGNIVFQPIPQSDNGLLHHIISITPGGFATGTTVSDSAEGEEPGETIADEFCVIDFDGLIIPNTGASVSVPASVMSQIAGAWTGNGNPTKVLILKNFTCNGISFPAIIPETAQSYNMGTEFYFTLYTTVTDKIQQGTLVIDNATGKRIEQSGFRITNQQAQRYNTFHTIETNTGGDSLQKINLQGLSLLSGYQDYGENGGNYPLSATTVAMSPYTYEDLAALAPADGSRLPVIFTGLGYPNSQYGFSDAFGSVYRESDYMAMSGIMCALVSNMGTAIPGLVSFILRVASDNTMTGSYTALTYKA